jgi:hypothetical protein
MYMALFNPLNALVSDTRILEYKQYLDDMRARERVTREEGNDFKLND